jgi:hypothetical protein
MMFRRSVFVKLVMLGLLALGVTGGLFLITEHSGDLAVDVSNGMAKAEPKSVALAKVETPASKVEVPLANLASEPGCECQGECGFAEQMRQNEH